MGLGPSIQPLPWTMRQDDKHLGGLGEENDQATPEDQFDVEDVALSLSNRTVTCTGASSKYYGAPMAVTSETHDLLDFWVNKLASNLYPRGLNVTLNPIRHHWFPMYITDKALVHQVLFMASCFRPYYLPSSASAQTEAFLSPVYEEVNKRLNDLQNISDATIAVIANLAWMESMRYASVSQVHMGALMKLVLLRGGMMSLNPRLRHKLHKVDIDNSVRDMKPPQFGPPPAATAIINQMVSSNPIKSPLAEGNIALEHAFMIFRSFATFIESAIDNEDVQVDPWTYDEQIVSLQYIFLSITGLTQGLHRACRLAALIYLRLIARPSLHNSLGVTAERLWAEISKLPVGDALPSQKPRSHSKKGLLKRDNQSALLWVLVVGIVACWDSPVRAMLMERLRTLAAREGIESWQPDGKRLVEQVVWVEKISGAWAELIWTKLKEEELDTSDGAASMSGEDPQTSSED